MAAAAAVSQAIAITSIRPPPSQSSGRSVAAGRRLSATPSIIWREAIGRRPRSQSGRPARGAALVPTRRDSAPGRARPQHRGELLDVRRGDVVEPQADVEPRRLGGAELDDPDNLGPAAYERLVGQKDV